MFSLATLSVTLKKYLLIAGAAVIALGLFALRFFNAGVNSQKTKQAEASLDSLRTRMKVNAKVDATSTDAVRDRLRDDWSDK